jgi:hypothetical protein
MFGYRRAPTVGQVKVMFGYRRAPTVGQVKVMFGYRRAPTVGQVKVMFGYRRAPTVGQMMVMFGYRRAPTVGQEKVMHFLECAALEAWNRVRALMEGHGTGTAGDSQMMVLCSYRRSPTVGQMMVLHSYRHAPYCGTGPDLKRSITLSSGTPYSASIHQVAPASANGPTTSCACCRLWSTVLPCIMKSKGVSSVRF